MTILVRPKFQALDSNGDPLSGGKVFFYEPGSTTAKDTYSDSTLTTPNANPVILDSRGEAEIYGSGSYRVILKDSSDVQIDDIDNVIGISAQSSASQWTSPGITPTYVSGTSFTVGGDQTNTYQAGRRFKATVTAGTIYGTIETSAYTSLTTVTVVCDSGSLDSGLSAVDVGLLSVDDPAVPYGIPPKKNTITPGSDGDVTLSAAENASTVRVLETGSWTSGHSLICGDVDREFTVVNNSSYTATITTSGTTPTTVNIPADGNPYLIQVRAGVGAELILPGKVLQVVSATDSSLVSGSTTMPHDDTIPQNTEGTELITASITPLSSTSKLIVEFNLQVSVSTGETLSYALFQDSTAAALAAGAKIFAAVNNPGQITMRYEMTSGTTSSTTFKVRAGVSTSGTVYMNGESAARRFGGVSQSIISITEVAA